VDKTAGVSDGQNKLTNYEVYDNESKVVVLTPETGNISTKGYDVGVYEIGGEENKDVVLVGDYKVNNEENNNPLNTYIIQ
jgi:hypothetical protein